MKSKHLAIKSIDLSSDAKILDLGCGNGQKNFALHKYNYLGVDINHRGQNIVKGDMQDFLETTKEQFDLIIADYSLHFVNYKKVFNLMLEHGKHIFVASIHIPQKDLVKMIEKAELLYWKSFLVHDRPHDGLEEHDHWVTHILVRKTAS